MPRGIGAIGAGVRAAPLAATATDVAAITALLPVLHSSAFNGLVRHRQRRDPRALAEAARSGRLLALGAAVRARLAGLLTDSPERLGERGAGCTTGRRARHWRPVEHRQLSGRTQRGRSALPPGL